MPLHDEGFISPGSNLSSAIDPDEGFILNFVNKNPSDYVLAATLQV
jgi:hypothetical protein